MADNPDPQGISRRALLTGGVAAAAAGLAGCTSKGSAASAAPPQATGSPLASAAAATSGASTPSPSATAAPTAAAAPVDPASVKANELGLVPVMMFHRITPTVNGEYDTTPADFRARLHQMFAAGYRPVRTIDLVRGDLRVAAGYTPAVMTFDDGYPDQFAMSDTGEIDPACGVGIMLDVCKQFPDCPPAGSFNINKNPFGLKDPAAQHAGLAKLHSLGFEIANHTFNHDNLSKLDAVGVQKDFVELQQLVQKAVPGASVLTMALPFGVSPHSRALSHAGSWQGESYTNEGVLLVGANPSHSPFSKQFVPTSIPRIRNSSWDNGNVALTAKYWLANLAANKSQVYVSAGNPGHVTIPKAWKQYVATQYLDKVITYGA
jgi:peptidoglycan/xylan/chitin deacetylase (PgdA/CDA1 family)